MKKSRTRKNFEKTYQSSPRKVKRAGTVPSEEVEHDDIPS
jgi:hypothetical protein